MKFENKNYEAELKEKSVIFTSKKGCGAVVVTLSDSKDGFFVAFVKPQCRNR